MSILPQAKESLAKNWNDWSSMYNPCIIEIESRCMEARKYENFEESFLLCFIKDFFLKISQNFTLIEFGSGTGRFMELLGFIVTKQAEKKPRFNKRFDYDEKLDKHLKGIVGIDFSEKMIAITKEKLESQKLIRLTEQGRVSLINKAIQDVNPHDFAIASNSPILICCMFGTFGNLPKADLDIALQKMYNIAGENGIIIISVFNKEEIKPKAIEYYNSIIPLWGEPDYSRIDDGDITTNKGFFAHWFEAVELCTAVRESFPSAIIIVGNKLKIKNSDMDSERGLILVASKRRIEVDMVRKVLEEIKGGSISKDSFYECIRM